MSDQIFGPIGPAPAAKPPAPRPRPQSDQAAAPGFAQVLQETLGGAGVKFSAHAQRRLAESEIRLEGPDLARIERAVDRAGQKGAKESLILLEDLALIVSIKNRTVITAVDGARARENVFTNVDSVVIG